MTKTVEQYDAELEGVFGEIDKLRKKVARLRGNREKAFLRDSSELLTDIEWLINNPTNNLQHDALRKWLAENVGGEYNGVSASMYNNFTNQQCFGLQLGWDAEEIAENKGERIANFKKFLELTLDYFKPDQDGVVEFGYATGEHSGCFNLEYSTGEKTWSTSATTYGRKHSVIEHDTFDDALEYAVKTAMTITD